jgi:integrase
MVLLIGSTGVRRSELMALVWTDVNVQTMEVSITKSCVCNRLGDTKTECSRRPVPLHPLVLESLLDWKRQSLYKNDGDFLFPSLQPGRVLGSAPFSTFAPLKRSGLGVEVVHLEGVVGGPDRDRTDDLFHAIFRRPRNLLILKASVAPEGPQRPPKNRLLLPHCSQKTRYCSHALSILFSAYSRP